MSLVIGDSGFIGFNFVLGWLVQSNEKVIYLDALTYAGNSENLTSLDADARHIFFHGNIGASVLVAKLLKHHKPSAVINFDPESHVDRLSHGLKDFIQTNFDRTSNLFESVRAFGLVARLMLNNSFAFCMCPSRKYMPPFKDAPAGTE